MTLRIQDNGGRGKSGQRAGQWLKVEFVISGRIVMQNSIAGEILAMQEEKIGKLEKENKLIRKEIAALVIYLETSEHSNEYSAKHAVAILKNVLE